MPENNSKKEAANTEKAIFDAHEKMNDEKAKAQPARKRQWNWRVGFWEGGKLWVFWGRNAGIGQYFIPGIRRSGIKTTSFMNITKKNWKLDIRKK